MDSLKVGARRTFEGFNALSELRRVFRVPFEPIKVSPGLKIRDVEQTQAVVAANGCFTA